MPPHLSPAVSRALAEAGRFAAGRGAASVAPEDLLAALLAEEDGRAAALAAEAGLDLTKVGFGPRADGSPVLGDEVDRVLFDARRTAAELPGEQAALSSEPVLATLLTARPDLAAGLERHGLRTGDLLASLEGRKPPPLPLDEPLFLADLTEAADIARILDAGLNRAREALRVLEDYARFALEDAFLCGELKRLRHDMARATEEHGPPGILYARETQHDPGVAITLEDERRRESLGDVAKVNFKRLQEALRSLAEFAKVPTPAFAEQLEAMRYRSYTLERAIVLGAGSRRLLAGARLYLLVSGATCSASVEWTIAEAAAGGVDVVQLREKALDGRELLRRARDAARWCRRAGVLFIVNDRPDIARLVEADGVHVGQDDLSVKDARRLLGPDAIIGASTHTLEQLRAAVLDGADYVGVGPVFASRTKSFEAFAGLDFVRAASAETTLPAFAIGGVSPENVGDVTAAGGRRVAVGQAITTADDPREAARRIKAALGDAPRVG